MKLYSYIVLFLALVSTLNLAALWRQTSRTATKARPLFTIQKPIATRGVSTTIPQQAPIITQKMPPQTFARKQQGVFPRLYSHTKEVIEQTLLESKIQKAFESLKLATKPLDYEKAINNIDSRIINRIVDNQTLLTFLIEQTAEYPQQLQKLFIQLLLNKGASPTINSALQVAINTKNVGAVEALIEHKDIKITEEIINTIKSMIQEYKKQLKEAKKGSFETLQFPRDIEKLETIKKDIEKAYWQKKGALEARSESEQALKTLREAQAKLEKMMGRPYRLPEKFRVKKPSPSGIYSF